MFFLCFFPAYVCANIQIPLHYQPSSGVYTANISINKHMESFNVIVDTGSANFILLGNQSLCPSCLSPNTTGRFTPGPYAIGSKKEFVIRYKTAQDTLKRFEAKFSIAGATNILYNFFMITHGVNPENTLGMAYHSIAVPEHQHPLTFFDVVIKQRKLSNQFSILLCGDTGNSMMLWGDHTFPGSNITLPIINKHFYALAFTGIRDNKNKPIIEYGKNVYQSAIVDTGTGGLTVLGENDHKKLIAYLFKTTSKKNQALGDKFWKDNYCVLKKNIDMASFPTLSIGFMDKQNKIHYLALAPHYYLNNGGCGLKYVRLSFTSYAKALPVLHKYQKLMPNFLTIPPIIFGTPLLEAYAFTVKRGEGASLHFTASGPLCQSSKP